MNKAIKVLNFFVILSLLFLEIAPVLAASQSSNYKVYNGSVTPIIDSGSAGSKQVQAGGSSISGSSNSSNYSSQQGTVFGIKPAPSPQPQQQQSGGGGGTFGVQEYNATISNLAVTNITSSSARISFDTKEASIGYIKYGKGNKSSLSNSTAKESSFFRNHSFTITNLVSNSAYYFEIHLQDSNKKSDISQVYSFTTLPVVKTSPSASNFQADIVQKKVVKLTWDNPSINNFRRTKVVRSTDSFPQKPSEGKLIFSGTDEYYIDGDTKAGTKYYYSAFVEDTSGNYSSAAIDAVEVPALEEPSEKEPIEPEEEKKTEKKPIKEEIIEEIEEEIEKEIDKEQKKEKEKQKKKEEKEFEIPVEEKPENYDITVPAEPPELPDIAVPVSEVGRSNADETMSMFTLFKQGVERSFDLINEKAKKADKETRDKLTQIRKDLIDESNRVKQDVYEQLTQKEKEQVQEVVIDKDIPTTTEEMRKTTAKIMPHSIKAKKEGADWHVYSDSEALFVIPAETFKKPVKSITLTINKEGYVLKYNEQTDNYEATIEAPPEKGKYEMIVQIIYEDSSYEQLKKTILVDPYGYVYRTKFRDWSWSKPWQIFTRKKVAIPEVKVTLYTKNKTGKWVEWPAHLYNQYNPQLTDDSGSFTFVVPPGEYYLAAQAEGYNKTKTFTVKNKIINKNIRLRKYSRVNVWSAVGISGIIVVSIGYLIIRRRTSSKNKENTSDE